MNRNPLHTIMSPSSVVFLRASNTLGKMGTSPLLRILYNEFPGRVLPVHPKEEKVLGSKAYPSIREIDLNPIVIVDGKPVVVDALFVG